MKAWHFTSLAAAMFFMAAAADAQLAITEVMPVTKLNTNTQFRGAEYWELTNFGTNDVNLHGYGFRDSVPTRPLVRTPFTNLTIRAGESVVFFRIDDAKQSVTNLAQFHHWWGGATPSTLQCRIWTSPGLSGWDGDEVVLFDTNGVLVDRVAFARARVGRAFTYEPETGLFGASSIAGVDGAVAAPLADDVGSPGWTTGPVPVRFLQQPVGATADSNTTIRLEVQAAGLPSPKYQWRRNGVPIANATQPMLTLANIHPTNAGAYDVWITNGLTGCLSEAAMLAVNTNPTAPAIMSAPADASVFVGQTASFSVAARALPAATYQWRANGIDIPGATASRLDVPNIAMNHSGTIYTVRVQNNAGSATASAAVYVSQRPDLRFTEVMALPSVEEDNQHFDWFEITNFDTNTVDLLGWRFSDEPSFARASTVTNSLVIRPGESVIFAERLNAFMFKRWWGADRVPEGLQVYTYAGFGLGAYGETLFLWNPAATSPYDYLATVSWAAATPGVSFEARQYCEDGACVDEAAWNSVAGVRGAFHASEGGHLGSPGYVENPVVRIVSITRDGANIEVRSRAIPGRSYRLRRAATSNMAGAVPLPVHPAADNVITLVDNPPPGDTWFYTVEELP